MPQEFGSLSLRTWRYRVDYPRRNAPARLTHKFSGRSAALAFVAKHYPDGAALFDRTTQRAGRVVVTLDGKARRARAAWMRRIAK